MSEKRKIQRFNLDEGRIWEAVEGLSPFKTTYTLEEVCEKLNEQQATIDKQELRLQHLEELLELSENLNKSYREKLIDMNLKMVIDNE